MYVMISTNEEQLTPETAVGAGTAKTRTRRAEYVERRLAKPDMSLQRKAQ